jgi:predicted RNase H-like HicB family nuclease
MIAALRSPARAAIARRAVEPDGRDLLQAIAAFLSKVLSSRRCIKERRDVAEHPNLAVETEREEDGRWLAEVPALPGAVAYGRTREEAAAKAEALALRVLAERLEHGEDVPEIAGLFQAA